MGDDCISKLEAAVFENKDRGSEKEESLQDPGEYCLMPDPRPDKNRGFLAERLVPIRIKVAILGARLDAFSGIKFRLQYA